MGEIRAALVPDRLQVFVSSTIHECRVERAAARRAVVGLNFEPVLFEREGARAEPPRDFYLRKLQSAHIVIGFYRESYGWVDEAKGMTLSGLEDEYREAMRLGKDLLAYVLKNPLGRDARLTTMLDELQSGPHTIYFYEDGEDLEKRLRDDLTALVSDRVARFQDSRSGKAASAAAILDSIYAGSPFRIRRGPLLDGLSSLALTQRVVWLTGPAGSGKTALAAEWAHERKASYVNARGLDPRGVLIEAARALGLASGPDLAVPVFEDARALLVSRWAEGQKWPLVLDDPDDTDSVWPVLAECLSAGGAGSVIIVSREPPPALPGERFEVQAFSTVEMAAVRAMAGLTVPVETDDLPIAVRRAAGGSSPRERFETLDAVSREALGYVSLSPTPLGLEDLAALVGGGVTAMDLSERLSALADILMEGPAGYAFIHDLYRDDVAAAVTLRVQLRALLADRLSKRLATTGRAWAAFTLQRDAGGPLATQLANRAVPEAVFTGSTRRLVEALEYLVGAYRAQDEPGPLVSVLMSLADARAHQGRPDEAEPLLEEALHLAKRLEDVEAARDIEVHQAVLALRRTASQSALERVRALALAAAADDRDTDHGRLLLEEGTALLGANEIDAAIPVFREARALFQQIEDGHGIEITTRNLVMALAVTPEGLVESERLRAELVERDAPSPRHRAWLCNLLIPRLRREGRLDEAESLAREAIAIGEELGDQYLVAINQVALGNILKTDGRVAAAIEAYAQGGQTAQRIGRPDLEARSSRLLALTENEAAEATQGDVRRAHAGRAEQYATQAALIFSRTFAWSEYAFALEERGDARRWLGDEEKAGDDYADAVAAYLKAGDEDEAARLLRNLLTLLDGGAATVDRIGRALGAVPADHDDGQSGLWLRTLAAALDHCPRKAAPYVLGTLVRAFYPGADGAWWFANFVRCMLGMKREPSEGRRAAGPLLLLAVLGFGRHRAFSTRELLILTGLCLGENAGVTLRHRPDQTLTQIIRLGEDARVLFTIQDDVLNPEATFVALCIGAFLAGFGDELSEILFAGGLPEGAAVDIAVLAQASATGDLQTFVAKGLEQTPVATARFEPDADGGSADVPVLVLVRRDAIEALEAHPQTGGELEFTLARVLEEIVHATLGASLDDDIYGAKVRDLLMEVLR